MGYQRKAVPPATVEKLRRLAELRDQAEAAYRKAVVDALKADASIREVSKVTGLSTSTLQRWGDELGWPTEAQKLAWMEARSRSSWPPEVQAILDELARRGE